MGSRDDPETRQASLLLSGLVLTPDDALETFRERAAADKALDVQHLKRARDVLDFVSAAINSGDSERWSRIEEIWKLLHSETLPPPASPPARAWARPPRPRMPTPAPLEPTEALDMDALKRDEDLEGTLPVAGAISQDLPFKPGDAEPPPPLSTTGGDMLGNTAYLDPDQRHDATTLPFDARAPSSPGSQSIAEVEPEPSSGGYEPTERLDVRAHALPKSEPKSDELPAHLNELTLEQHAALSAECSVYPEWREQIEARYSLQSSAEREQLDRHFQELMRDDASLRDQWRWHYQRYESWARQRRR